jgi:hypothetical protein
MSGKIFVCLVAAIACAAAPLGAEQVARPSVPGNIEVRAPFKPFLKAHAYGTQNYICAPAATATGVDWVFIGPQATLFAADLDQSLTHFHSRNLSKPGEPIQATWQHSRDSSAVWATRFDGSTDPLYVAADAVEWLLLEFSGAELGPTGGDKLARTAWIQRINTVGGLKPPSAQCTVALLNTRRLVPYEADYYFYR